jgi:hypothetical protein
MPLLDNDLLSPGFKYRSLADASPGVHTGGPFVLVEQDERNRTGPMGKSDLTYLEGIHDLDTNYQVRSTLKPTNSTGGSIRSYEGLSGS